MEWTKSTPKLIPYTYSIDNSIFPCAIINLLHFCYIEILLFYIIALLLHIIYNTINLYTNFEYIQGVFKFCHEKSL